MSNNWQTKKLGELFDFQNGRSFNKTDWSQTGIPIIRIQNLNNTESEFNYYQGSYHKNIEVNKGDLLFSWSGTIGSSFGPHQWNKEMGLLNQHIFKVNFKTTTDRRYAYYLLKYITEEIEKNVNGAVGLVHITKTKINNLDVYNPTLAEQEHIAILLDDIFEKIEKAKKNMERNLQNSRELFEAYLENIFSNPQWEKKTLGEVIEGVEYGSSSKSKSTGKIPVLRMGNIQNGRFNWDKLVYTDDENEISKYSLKYNDVLFNRTNSPELVGKTAIYKGEEPAIFAGYLIRIHREEKLLNADYLNYYLNSSRAREYGKTVTISSVNQANINGKKLKSYPITLPPLKEQETIVEKLDELSAQTKRLKEIYKNRLTELEELKKSVLQKAFAGGLIKSNSQSIQAPVTVSPYVRNQVHAAIIERVVQDGGSTTEVAVAKYDHLLQEVYGLSLGYQFQQQQFGPFDAQIKRLVSSGLGQHNRWFTKKQGMIVFGSNINSLLSRPSNLYKTAQSAMEELKGLKVTKLDVDKIELLSTVCHSIKETQSTSSENIRNFMSQWQTDGNRTKAEKFSLDQTNKCLEFIINNNLHIKLLNI